MPETKNLHSEIVVGNVNEITQKDVGMENQLSECGTSKGDQFLDECSNSDLSLPQEFNSDIPKPVVTDQADNFAQNPEHQNGSQVCLKIQFLYERSIGVVDHTRTC